MGDDVIIIAVGKDKPGLVASVTSIIAELSGNIEEMDQVVLRNIFIMSLVVRFLNSEFSGKFEKLCEALAKEGERVGLRIHAYRLSDL